MNSRRDFFRIWIICSAVFGLAVCVTSYSAIRDEFEAARRSRYSFDASLRSAQPWKGLLETAGLALGVPLGALAAGWALLRIAAWFRSALPQTVGSFRGAMPRIYELKDRTDLADPNAFFRNLEESLTANRSKLEAFLRLERQLSVLPDDAWSDLKKRASDCLHQPVPGRGWQALFDIFNEAKGFAYLQRIGCEKVRFIPRAMVKTPDLEGSLDGHVVLCEVKTINISELEAQERDRIHEGQIVGREVRSTLTDALRNKLASTLIVAVQQLVSYDPDGQARHIVLVVIHFDDWVGDHQPEYFAQIDAYLLANPITGAALVVCPARNLFNRTFKMRAATVVEL